MTSSLFVATVEHHTQAQAAALPEAAGLPYLGIWTMPLPYGGRVHVFSDEPADRLEAAGWTREERP